MKRLALAFVLTLLPSLATAGAPALRQAMQAPGWIQNDPWANVVADFSGQRYWLRGAGLVHRNAIFTITRASSKTNLLPTSPSGFVYSTFNNNVPATSYGYGVLIEDTRTNQLTTSTAPATQTTGSLANGTYTLWVNGSGSATMSAGTATGCGTGAATQGTPVTFTTTGAAGTCTVTVAGSLNAFQLELGSPGSSFIVTAGAAATRSGDSLLSAGALQTIFLGSSFTFRSTTNGLVGTASKNAVHVGYSATNGALIYGPSTAVSAWHTFNNTTDLGTANTATIAALNSALIGASATGRTLSLNGGTVVTDANTFSTSGFNLQLGFNSTANQYENGYEVKLSGWNYRLNDTQIRAFSVLP